MPGIKLLSLVLDVNKSEFDLFHSTSFSSMYWLNPWMTSTKLNGPEGGVAGATGGVAIVPFRRETLVSQGIC